MQRSFMGILAAVFTLFAAGCFVPGEFSAKLDLKKNGEYSFAYEGTVIHALMRESRKDGELAEEDEKEIVEEVLRVYSEDDAVESLAYIGDDTFKISYRKAGNVRDNPMHAFEDEFSVFTLVLLDGNESPTLAEFHFMRKFAKDEEMQEAREMFAPMRGTIAVTMEAPPITIKGGPEKTSDTEFVWRVAGLKDEMPSMVFACPGNE